MGVVDRVDGFQRRHPGVGFPLGVLYKYVDDGGGYLAALIAYYAFVSLFPLLLLLSTVLGLVLAGHPAVQQQVLGSALAQSRSSATSSARRRRSAVARSASWSGCSGRCTAASGSPRPSSTR